MQKGKVNIVIDAQWGSSGKGKLASFLATQNVIEHLSVSNMPNAGHTVVREDKKWVFKVLPSASAILPESTVWICPGSVFEVSKLAQERVDAKQTGKLFIHARAVPMVPQDKAVEAQIDSIRKIASTAQGCSVAMMRKRFREALATYEGYQYKYLGASDALFPQQWTSMLRGVLDAGDMLLHEVSQGFALSLDWGTHYPECTSRNCTTQAALDDLGLAPKFLGDVYLNVRTYPIRVGNTADGNSGGWMPDQTEVDWEHVAATAGLDAEELKKREHTTVTGRLRRVATFSYDLVRQAAEHNQATAIFVNFAQYITHEVAGMRGERKDLLPRSVRVFCDSIENACNVPVVGVGTGADALDTVWWGK